MKDRIGKFEEFNIGRDLKFKGSKKNMTLCLVHGLDGEILHSSIAAIKSMNDFKDVINCHIDDLVKLRSLDHKNLCVYAVHLPLDQEINLHKTISKWAMDYGIAQANPYNKIAKIFDDKFLFYALMTANEIRQPFTLAIHRNNKYLGEDELQKINRYKNIVVKPRCGTEKIDFALIPSKDFNLSHEAISKILQYDDCLVQEYIADALETKALYMFGDLYIMEDWGKEQYDFVAEIVDIVDGFAATNQLIMPEIFSIDLMKTGNEIIVLEANIRPAAIYKYRPWQ